MRTRVLIILSFCGLRAFVPAGAGAPQAVFQESFQRSAENDLWQAIPAHAMIDEIQIFGLHRIPIETAKSRIALHPGGEWNPRQLTADIHALTRLGWFDDVSVAAEKLSDAADGPAHLRLKFYFREYPLLTGVDYRGSKLLSAPQIRKMLEEKKLTPPLGLPADPVKLQRIAIAIQSELASLGHPQARVAVEREKQPGQAVNAFFRVHDGPHLPVVRVGFSGDPGLPPAVLRRQMREIEPTAWFSGLRSKNAFTPEKSEQDRINLLTYFLNHGFPEARVGVPQLRPDTFPARGWPWLHHRPETALSLTLPVEAGTLYRFGPTELSADLQQRLAPKRKGEAIFGDMRPGQPFSQHELQTLQRSWERRLYRKAKHRKADPGYRLRAIPAFDAATHLAKVKFDFDPLPPYRVGRIDFRGNLRFPDRYLRRRIGLSEGQALDEYALEAGLARLVRTGYFQPFRAEDIHIETHEATRTADITIHMREKGRQRVTFSGGREQFGSTLGIAYTVFNLLGMDEFISTQFDGGPETLELAISFAKEGFLGSRGTLALSLFDTFLRPRLVSSPQAPFLRSRTAGMNLGWTYAASDVDALGINLGVSRASSAYMLNPVPGSADTQPTDLRSDTSRHSLGVAWTRYGGAQKIQLTDSVSGGWLGGSENLLCSKAEYGQIFPDRVFHHHHTWAWRTAVSAAGSYKGDLPLSARIYSGDDLVRGLRPGELGPYETFETVSSSGATSYSAVPAGANLVAASNLEYRFPLRHGWEGATFFDTGSGLLLPNWLGKTRPSLIDSTDRVFHASTGFETRWTLPGVGVPVRVNYSFNLLRLNRALLMPDGSIFRVRNRMGALGWGFGPLF